MLEMGPHGKPSRFSDFKKKQLVQVKGSAIIIMNKAGLEVLVGG
jgi:hypothetical protein